MNILTIIFYFLDLKDFIKKVLKCLFTKRIIIFVEVFFNECTKINPTNVKPFAKIKT